MLDDSARTLVMGVLNVTSDSFSDGGLWLDPVRAIDHGAAMLSDGADIIDVGAESTRPGATRVPAEEERRRVLSVVPELVRRGAVVSVDTTRASVAEAALAAGATMVNDVSGGMLDPDLPRVAADHDCRYVVQHWRGWLGGAAAGREPDADTSVYRHGVLADVRDELLRQVDAVLSAGVGPERIVIDPGLGFSKPTVGHNMPLLAGLREFVGTGYPVLVGASRKRFVSRMLDGAGRADGAAGHPEALDEATAAISALCAEHGAWAVRVHDVRRSRIAVRIGATWREYEHAYDERRNVGYHTTDGGDGAGNPRRAGFRA